MFHYPSIQGGGAGRGGVGWNCQVLGYLILFSRWGGNTQSWAQIGSWPRMRGQPSLMEIAILLLRAMYFTYTKSPSFPRRLIIISLFRGGLNCHFAGAVTKANNGKLMYQNWKVLFTLCAHEQPPEICTLADVHTRQKKIRWMPKLGPRLGEIFRTNITFPYMEKRKNGISGEWKR